MLIINKLLFSIGRGPVEGRNGETTEGSRRKAEARGGGDR